MGKLMRWFTARPDALVALAAGLVAYDMALFARAVAWRAEVRRQASDLARAASEALGG